jgi:heme/copper-type cytochrome/quinol oxidase subunit 3
MVPMNCFFRATCILLIVANGVIGAQSGANSTEFQSSSKSEEPESALRRGEVVFFISYPFTFLGSFGTYMIAGYAAAAIDGKNNFAPQGGFYGLVALTAAILSFGIAMDDYYAIKAQAMNDSGQAGGYLSIAFRY